MYILFALTAGLVGCLHINRLYILSESVWREFRKLVISNSIIVAPCFVPLLSVAVLFFHQFHHLRPARLSSYLDQMNEMKIASSPRTEKACFHSSAKKTRVTKKNKIYPALKIENAH